MKAKVECLKPFGPKIFKIELPKDTVKKLTKITDELIVDENRKNYGCNLAGQIKEEVEISKKILSEQKLYDEFRSYLNTYVQYCLKESGKMDIKKHSTIVDITSMWFNEMKPGGEYNPIHYHSSCHVSSTLYLKIPKNRPKRNIECKNDREGMIEFVDRSVAPDMLTKGAISLQPKVGDMYMWPSSLFHCVYPFLGDEVRRSIAWNGTYRMIDKEKKVIVLGGTPSPI